MKEEAVRLFFLFICLFVTAPVGDGVIVGAQIEKCILLNELWAIVVVVVVVATFFACLHSRLLSTWTWVH